MHVNLCGCDFFFKKRFGKIFLKKFKKINKRRKKPNTGALCGTRRSHAGAMDTL